MNYALAELHRVKPCLLGGLVVFVLGLNVVSLRPQTLSPSAPSSLSSAKSGLDYFRQLLAASPEERQKLLVGRSAEHREVLENGLRKYDALAPAERDHGLRLMALRFHLASLMAVAPSNREGRLKQVPLSERVLVEQRLRIWDQLPPEDQKDLLQKERLARVVGVLVPSPRPARGRLSPGNTTSNEWRQMESSLGLLNALSEAKRARIQANFERLFQLPDPAQASEELESLQLGPAELDLMKKALERFRRIPRPQRDACLENFKKLSQLPPQEMRQFLRNAEEWKKMSPEDRAQWRMLVNKLMPLPPLPPGFSLPPSPPNLLPSSRPAIADATNR